MIINTEVQLVHAPDDQCGHILAKYIGDVIGELDHFRNTCAERFLNFELPTRSLVPAGVIWADSNSLHP